MVEAAATPHWRVTRHDDGVVVAAYRNDPMNYFTAEGAGKLLSSSAPGPTPPSGPSS